MGLRTTAERTNDPTQNGKMAAILGLLDAPPSGERAWKSLAPIQPVPRYPAALRATPIVMIWKMVTSPTPPPIECRWK